MESIHHAGDRFHNSGKSLELQSRVVTIKMDIETVNCELLQRSKTKEV